jgi:hypothetical protein
LQITLSADDIRFNFKDSGTGAATASATAVAATSAATAVLLKRQRVSKTSKGYVVFVYFSFQGWQIYVETL